MTEIKPRTVVHENGEVLNEARWTGTDADVSPMKFGRTVSHLTPDEIADNEKHDAALVKARLTTEDDDDPPE